MKKKTGRSGLPDFNRIYEITDSTDFSHYKKITGNRIYEFRHSLDLSRDKFAELCGISPSFLSDVERGIKSITIITLYKICCTFNVSADYFVLGHDEGYQNDIALEILNTFSKAEKDIVIKILSDLSLLLKVERENGKSDS